MKIFPIFTQRFLLSRIDFFMMSDIPSIIDTSALEKREYQVNIFEQIKGENSLVILPTGLGKTAIAVYAICWNLEQEKKALMMAPTRPLCQQHIDYLLDTTSLEKEQLKLITGELYDSEERRDIWQEDYDVFVATPQTVNNDLHEIPLSSLGLMIFDEVHRTTGDYAYAEIGKACKDKMDILGLTASPGSSFDKLVEVCENLGIENIEVRTLKDTDVKDYVPDRSIEWIEIEKTEELKDMEDNLNSVLKGFIEDLSDYTKQVKNIEFEKIGKSVLVDIQDNLKDRVKKENKGYLFHALSLTSACIKLIHLKELILTQGIDSAYRYYLKLQEEDSRASKYICKRDEIEKIGDELLDLKAMPVEINPKLNEAKRILKEELSEGRAMIFAQYRDTVDYLVKELRGLNDFTVESLIGQSSKDGEKGMDQKEQKETLEHFREGDIDILVSTSIGEEGLDIPSTELVLFYEAVPSAIRSIQRKGRTGRDGREGSVFVLITEDTKDEAFYWKSYHQEKEMYNNVRELEKKLEKSEDPRKTIDSLKEEDNGAEQSSLENF